VKMDGFKLCLCHGPILHSHAPEVQRLFGISPAASIHNADHFRAEQPHRSAG
jgi:hypothetical protein